METLVKKLVLLLYKKFNKQGTPKTYHINYNTIHGTSKVDYKNSECNKQDIINIDYLTNRLKQKSYKSYLIFKNLELSPSILSLIFVLSNIRYKIYIPTRKIALGLVNNICIFKDDLPVHVYNLLEIIHFNSKIYADSTIAEIYRQRVITLPDDILDFYIGMYDLFMVINDKKEQNYSTGDICNGSNEVNKTENSEIESKGNKTHNNTHINNTHNNTHINKTHNNTHINNIHNFIWSEYHKKNIKQIFFLERSDFLENLFFNFKEIKRLSKMTYSYILQETIRNTLNREINELEIILVDSGFVLYYNIPEKDYSYKISKIFKFFYKLKKVEYLCRKLKFFEFTYFINRLYFYLCEEIISNRDVFSRD